MALTVVYPPLQSSGSDELSHATAMSQDDEAGRNGVRGAVSPVQKQKPTGESPLGNDNAGTTSGNPHTPAASAVPGPLPLIAQQVETLAPVPNQATLFPARTKMAPPTPSPSPRLEHQTRQIKEKDATDLANRRVGTAQEKKHTDNKKDQPSPKKPSVQAPASTILPSQPKGVSLQAAYPSEHSQGGFCPPQLRQEKQVAAVPRTGPELGRSLRRTIPSTFRPLYPKVHPSPPKSSGGKNKIQPNGSFHHQQSKVGAEQRVESSQRFASPLLCPTKLPPPPPPYRAKPKQEKLATTREAAVDTTLLPHRRLGLAPRAGGMADHKNKPGPSYFGTKKERKDSLFVAPPPPALGRAKADVEWYNNRRDSGMVFPSAPPYQDELPPPPPPHRPKTKPGKKGGVTSSRQEGFDSVPLSCRPLCHPTLLKPPPAYSLADGAKMDPSDSCPTIASHFRNRPPLLPTHETASGFFRQTMKVEKRSEPGCLSPGFAGDPGLQKATTSVPQAASGAIDHSATGGLAFRKAGIVEEQDWLERKLQQERRQEILAQRLQKQLEYEDFMQRQEQCARNDKQQQIFLDAGQHLNQDFLAQQLQQQLELEDNLERKRLRDLAEHEMESSAAGKAWKFVERVHELHRTKAQLYGERPVSIDDMVFLAERMFEAQEDFRSRGLPCTVDIGYHYTWKANMSQIRIDGLLSKAEREAKNIANNFNGETYGPGIYTGNDPKTFSRYGSVGLIVARLKGRAMDPKTAERQYSRGNTSIVSGALVVLQKSCQCLALLQFRRKYADDVMQAYSADLYAIVDEFFNGEECYEIPLTRSVNQQPRTDIPSAHAPRTGKKSAAPGGLTAEQSNNAGGSTERREPTRRVFRNPAELLYYCAPSSLGMIDSRGTMPSGSMQVSTDAAYTCSGFSPGTIVIRYTIPAGIQQSYHENAGRKHKSTYREAYLPDNETGRHLLRRLKVAFMRGLTFTVGKSATSGQTDSVVWASIPHKTSLTGGLYGFPDPQYFVECNSRLDSLGVPQDCSAYQ